ncbi:dicarboxylic acid transporter PcaT [Serratia rubidaea]|uniref:MFS transporter n=1 Tax=Serratia rubidaea TaxID=61652 RepID=UPI000773402E|nr:MFS transporter [Serratia rubidaea]AML58636.1 dicarboxylic acid transporter PcaT [Serratia rubidaea]
MHTVETSQRKIIVAAVFGNLLEFYDFTVYSYFALAISKQFFPSHDPVISTMLAFSAFAIGFVARPLGGVVLGYYADRKGRRAALTMTIMLMALGAAMIGLAPNYAAIGVAAPALIVLARLFQGFARGGEFGAATATLLETGSDERRGFRASWQLASQGAAALLGAAVAAVLTFSLSAEALAEWGWRIPFLLGTLIVPVGIYLRRHIVDEPPAAKPAERRMFEARHVRNWLLTVFSIMGMSVSSYIMIYYLPTYSIQQLGLPERLSIMVALATSVISFVMCPIYGAWSDKLRKRKPLAMFGRLMLLLLLYPAFWAMTHFPTLPAVMSVMIVLMLFYTMGSAPAYALMPESFPRHIRASYMASAYAVAVSLFGGTAQLVAAWLLDVTGNKMAPAWYMMICVLISLLAVARFEETGDKALE